MNMGPIGHVGSTGPTGVYVLAGDTVVAAGRRILPKAGNRATGA